MILVQLIRAYIERREAIRELSMMDDKLLQDIGISRGDIPFAVREGKR